MPVSFELPQDPSDDLVTMKASGKLTSADYDQFLPLIESTFQNHKKVRFLLILENFHGWDAGAFWKDFKFDIKHFTDMQRVAIVGESKWQDWATTLCKPLTTAEVRYFDLPQLDEAKLWVRA